MISIEGLSKTFDTQRNRPYLAITDIDLKVADGEFVSILGPSGCGKSTLLYIVGGFVPPSTGAVLVDGKPVEGPGPDRGPVFQEFALFPWKTVLGNVMYGLLEQGQKRKDAEARARELLAMVHLTRYADFYPKELSGGMKQRVAICRTLAYRPKILLMDEPFGALDAHTRVRLQNELLEIWERDRKTVLFVTHSVEEAVFLSDRVVVMTRSPGRIKEIIPIDLPRPRRRAELLVDAPLSALRGRHREDDGKSGRRGGAGMKAADLDTGRAAADRVLLRCWWRGRASRGWSGSNRLPTAWESLQELPAILRDPRSLYDILSSVRRMVIGFALAVAFAVPVGLMMGRSRKVAAFFNPLFMMIYPVPKAALMPIIMLWLGIGDASKTLVIFLGVSLPVIYHTYQGSQGGRREAALVRRRDGHEQARAIAAHRAAGGDAGNHGRLPHRPRARADHHGDERDDRAPGRDRQSPVQLARPCAIFHDLRHHRHRRRPRLRARPAVREGARRGGRLGRSGAPDRGRLGMTMQRRISELAIGMIPILLLLGLWHYLAAFKIAPPTLLPRARSGIRALRAACSAIRPSCRMPGSRSIACSGASGSRWWWVSRSALRARGARSWARCFAR